jgi:CHAD domain-containing protein
VVRDNEGMAASRHEEIERKYAVEPDTGSPALDDVDGVAEVGSLVESDLEAVYFDTPELELLRHGITVRRRVGGNDDGWHLKEPSGPDARTETRLPLGRSVRTVPRALREHIESVLGTARLVPVARMGTHRSERGLYDAQGTRIAHFCDDDVHAERLLPPGLRQHWREWEIELVGDDRDLLRRLDTAMLAAGAVPAGMSSKVSRALALQSQTRAGERLDPPHRRSDTRHVLRAYLATQLTVLQEHDSGLRGETVHQLRIAARRLRSVLASHQPVLEPGAVEPVREELRWLGSSLGPARDFEVLRRHLDALADDELDEPAGPAPGTLRHRINHDLEQAHRIGHRTATEVVASQRYGRLLGLLEGAVHSPALLPDASKGARTVLPAILARDAKRVRRAAKAAHHVDPGPDRDDALHEVRKKAKRLRYSAEAATPVLGKRAKTLAKRAKSLQDALGAHQDSVASRAWLKDLAERADGEVVVAFGAGRLHAREELRAYSAEREYEKALRRLPRKRVAAWLRGKGG